MTYQEALSYGYYCIIKRVINSDGDIDFNEDEFVDYFLREVEAFNYKEKLKDTKYHIHIIEKSTFDLNDVLFYGSSVQRTLTMLHLYRDVLDSEEVEHICVKNGSINPLMNEICDSITYVCDNYNRSVSLDLLEIEQPSLDRLYQFMQKNLFFSFINTLTNFTENGYMYWLILEICQFNHHIKLPEDYATIALANGLGPNELCILADRFEEIGFPNQDIIRFMHRPIHHCDSWILWYYRNLKNE